MQTYLTKNDEAEAKVILQNKVNAHIAENGRSIETAFNSIENDWANLNDHIAPVDALNFGLNDGKVIMSGFGENPASFNDHSIVQLASKLAVPTRYLKDLYRGADWQRELAVNILNEHKAHNMRERLLIREVDGVARGLLSDRYKRLSTRMIFMAFLEEIKNHDMTLLNSFNGTTKSYLEAINPNIISIDTPNNGTVHMVYGVQLRNSEFGDSALELRGYEMQCICLNGLVTQSAIREVHLGKRLADNVTWSKRTYERDSQTKASMVKDYIKHFFSEDAEVLKREKIQKASSIEVDIDKEIKKLPKMGMTDQEAEHTKEILLQNNPGDGVQGKATLWKFAQGVGAVSRQKENPQRQRELEEVAGKIMARTGF